MRTGNNQIINANYDLDDQLTLIDSGLDKTRSPVSGGWDSFVWINVSVLEGVLGAARYCAKGTICNDRRSLQTQLGAWGRCEPPSRSRAVPWWGPRGQSPRKL